MIKTYVALDLETTGLNPATDRIIEIGAVKVVEGEVVSTLSTLIDPQVPISFRVSELTGIDASMIAGQPVIDDLITDILEFTEDLPILGHNIIFDYSFLKKAAVNNRLTFEKDGIDTLKMARRILPELEHRGLEYLCGYFGIRPEKSHRAMDDAISAMKIYEKLFEIAPQDTGFTELVGLNYTVKHDTPITPAQISYLSKLTAYHKVPLEAKIESLTKSQASRMIDGIISSYGKLT